MLKVVQSYIEEHNMINKGDRIVIGVSGGADSVCLFHVFRQMIPLFDLTLFVVHVNHGIRGEEADVPVLAELKGLTEEEAGRLVRYESFNDCYKKYKCNKIAIAHNKNDNAETILFHLFRGSGIKGLTGIPNVRNEIIRPLLCVKREEIEVYLNENHISYRNDRTNFTDDYSRNKIRHRIISYAQKELNTKVIENIVNASNHLGEVNRYLEKNIKKAYDNIVKKVDNEEVYELPVNLLKEEDRVIQKGIVRLVYENLACGLKDVEALHIEQILSLQDREVGKRFNLPYKVVAEKGYDNIVIKFQTKDCKKNQIKKIRDLNSEQVLTVPGEFFLPYMNQTIQVSLKNYKKNMIIPKNGCTKWFDYDKIKNTVLIRTRKEGDFIQIDSLGNRKKIKSLFIDDKIPREHRNQIPLIADGNHVIWVVGGRMSEAYKVSDKTKIILEISLNGGKQDARQN